MTEMMELITKPFYYCLQTLDDFQSQIQLLHQSFDWFATLITCHPNLPNNAQQLIPANLEGSLPRQIKPDLSTHPQLIATSSPTQPQTHHTHITTHAIITFLHLHCHATCPHPCNTSSLFHPPVHTQTACHYLPQPAICSSHKHLTCLSHVQHLLLPVLPVQTPYPIFPTKCSHIPTLRCLS